MSDINDIEIKNAIDEKSSNEDIPKFSLPYIAICEEHKNNILAFYLPTSSSKTITIPEDVTAIDQYAFDWDDFSAFWKDEYGEELQCPDDLGTKIIEKIILHKELKCIENDAFLGLDNLKVIEVDKENPYFVGGDTLFETRRNEFSYWRFIWCSSAKTGDYQVPSHICTIGPKAFANSKLNSVTMLEDVSFIFEDSFENCRNLTLKGYAGSYVEKYAKENEMPFEAIELVIKGYAGGFAEKYAKENGFPFEVIEE